MSAPISENESLSTFYIGHHETRRRYIITEEILSHALDINYDMLTSPITNDAFHSRVLTQLSAHLRVLEDSTLSSRNLPDVSSSPSLSSLNLDDTSLTPSDPVSQVILTVSPWIDLASPDPLIADLSRQVLMLEVAYASFCGASNILIYGPQLHQGQTLNDGLPQFARAMKGALSISGFVNIQILLPMTQSLATSNFRSEIGDLSKFARSQFLPKDSFNTKDRYEIDLFSSWDSWNMIRSLCNYNGRLSVALTIPPKLPPASVQSRWFAEPLRIISIPGSSFQNNPRSGISLTQPQRQLIFHYMKLRSPPWILLTDIGPLPGLEPLSSTSAITEQLDSNDKLPDRSKSSSTENPTPAEAAHQLPQQNNFRVSSHPEYIRQLQYKQPGKPPIERFGAGYQDYLQNPLQPLTDNLESITYEVFEKDPVKYDWYENAIAEALRDWKRLGRTTSGTNGNVVVAVAGAGRGPLVSRALKASASSGVDIEMWAVEKNHNAFVLLQRHNINRWDRKVNLVQSDMRSWQGPTVLPEEGEYAALGPHSASNLFEEESETQHISVDILISELLGSFGDNELSPECLDGIQHLLNPAHGISIPCSYTAHLTPISAPKIHADILARSNSGDSEASQIPYVVMLHAVDYLSTSKVKPSGNVKANSIVSSSASAAISDFTPIILQAWEFSHPLPPQWLQQFMKGARQSSNAHNERFARLEYPCFNRGLCHGLGGYFETVLYAPFASGKEQQWPNGETSRGSEPIELSTHPLTIDQKSKDMISWFPIYFPLKTPLYVPDESIIAVSIWRKTDGRGVWYEWLVETFMSVGSPPKRIRLGSSELHSSAKNACLM